MKMAKSKKVGVFSLAKLQAATMACAGLIAGFLYSVGGAIYYISTTGSVNFGTTLAFLALIVMPVLFAIFGLIAGFIGAPLYNFIAERIGGIETSFEQEV